MSIQENTLPAAKPHSGWIMVGMIASGFTGLFLLNFLVPLDRYSYTTRIWEWTILAAAVGALGIVVMRWRSIRAKTVLLGALLALISSWSYLIHNPDVRGGMIRGIAVMLAFTAGTALFQTLNERGVPVFRLPWSGIACRIGFGFLAAVPLAFVNNAFFYLQNGAPRFGKLLTSGAAALSPAIHEEVVFRYFVLAVCLSLLKDSARPRVALAAAVTMAVVPHSLLHLPDLFLQNPPMAFLMLVATSVLFGLPMALLQIKNSFEASAAFHWFIDFLRFLFGY